LKGRERISFLSLRERIKVRVGLIFILLCERSS